MPARYGNSAAEEARLRRARRRAGTISKPKPIRDSRTVSTIRQETAAREKARRDFPTPQSLASPAGIRRLQQVTAERNRAVAARTKRYGSGTDLLGEGLRVAEYTGVPQLVRDAKWAVTHPVARVKGEGRASEPRMEFPGFGPLGRAARLGRKGARAAAEGSLRRVPKNADAAPARPTGADKIVEALPEARRVRAKQQAGYGAARGKKGGAAELAYERAGGGEAGRIAAKAELKGELPKLPFGRLVKEFGEADSELRAVFQPQVDEMLDFITAHPSMQGRPLTAVRARDALTKALDGVTPQKSEIRLLEQVFGEEAAQHFKWRAARDRALKLANVPRSMQASYDLSIGLRQLLVAGVRHPVVWQRVMRAQVKAARSQKAADAMLAEIRARPRYDQMLDDGVKLTDIKVRSGRLEEDFIGAEYAERIPVVGRPVKWSSRAFTVGGATMRADLYDLFMDQAERAGKTLTKKERRDFTSVINAATGRGGMGVDMLERAAPLGTVLLFSPRLIASRLAFLNPLWYAKLSGPARKEAASSFLSVFALGSAVLWMAKELGADVEMDPRSADFGKIQVGDTRVDIWGGFQQYVVNGYRYAVSETKGPDGAVKDKTREEILWNFASGKAAPLPGLARDFQRGRTFDYQPVDEKAVGKLFVPFNIQNAWDAKDDPKLAAASFGLGGIGLGMQTYGAEPNKGTTSKSLRGGSGGKSKSLRVGKKKSKSLRR